MKKKKIFRFFGWLLLLAMIIIQFIPVDRSVPDVESGQDFFAIHEAPEEMKSLIRQACYSCHSYESEYPWYAHVAPISGWIQGHIDHGRDECNFSIWGTYSAKKSDHKLEESAEMVLKGEMPLKSFTRFGLHPEARISDEQRVELADWFESLR